MAEEPSNLNILGDEDYCRLHDLCLPLASSPSSASSSSSSPPPPPPPPSCPSSPSSRDDTKTFAVCLWIYLVKDAAPGLLLRMVCSETKEERPLLSIDPEMLLNLHWWETSFSVSAPQACPLEKWVHIGCEVGKGVIRLHIDGAMAAEKHVNGTAISSWDGTLTVMGGNGAKTCSTPQVYVHHARVLPQPTVSNHYVKNPPLELALDGSTGASDDYEVEEGGDGIWSVVGGKASCRRNFSLDVVLLDALGRSVHKDMEILALLIYADNNHPVEKPKDDAEAPLLTTFDGVEFPSTERPIKLVHGRASFKLKISQLSSKCDNRLFRVCFDSPSFPSYPFLQVFSRPIRCVSRNRNSRCPSLPLKRSLITETSWMPEESVTETSAYANASNVQSGMKWYTGHYQAKRARVVPEPLRYVSYQPSDTYGIQLNPLTPDVTALPPVEEMDEECARSSRNMHTLGSPLSCPVQKEITMVLDHPSNEGKARESMGVNNIAWSHGPSFTGPLLDFLVFKYSLEGVQSRAAFLRGAITCWSDQLLSEFAKQVSHATSCKHTGHQILIARNLIQDGNQVWREITRNEYPVSWETVMEHVERHIFDPSSSRKRRFSPKDKLFLKRLTKCGVRDVSRDGFDRLWYWIYPVYQSLLDPRVKSTWEIEEPTHVLSMVSREEAEALMRCSNAPPFMLRFVNTCSWPHPDAGGLIITYIGKNLRIHHKLLSLDSVSRFNGVGNKRSLLETILAQDEISQAWKHQP